MKPKNHLDIRELVESGILPGNNSEGSIRAMISRRQIPFRKLGGSIYFLRDEVIEWLRTRPGNPLKGRRQAGNPEVQSLTAAIEALPFTDESLEGLRRAIEELTISIELQNI